MTKPELVSKLESAADHLREASLDLANCEPAIRSLAEASHLRQVEVDLIVSNEYIGRGASSVIRLLEYLRHL